MDIKIVLEEFIELEAFGIQIENVVEDKENGKIKIYFSVPEFTIIDAKGELLPEPINGSDTLIPLAKEKLLLLMANQFDYDAMNNLFENSDPDTRVHQEYSIFYAKIRKNECWNDDTANKRISELQNQMLQGYQEIKNTKFED